eukprot:CAMPEP_0171335570 /NCGR_PEP_ID=MMETSP0878-20121228/5431_1 /TAXON_ID=67004 /ORGANISM="Thalassiosira weissflogii, Strain CCMP1336" /LENGTH=325 /DNA_ID=CAMNT_0011836861 /DNA_START=131 /DNA_END=1108 /DNA_ORIENTATION=-
MTSKKSLPSILRPPKRRSSTFSGDDDHVSPRRRSSVTFLLDDDDNDNDDDETPSRANPPTCDRRAAASHSRFREQGRASRTYHNMERRQIQQTTTRRSSTNVVIKKSVDFPQKKRFSCGDVIGTEAKPDRFPSGNHPSKNIDIGRIGVGRQHAYQVGETLRPADQQYLIQPHTSCVENKQGEDKEILQSISALKINDHAFIKRSNGQFTYAILAERKSNTSKSHDKQNNDDSMLFIISLKGHSKLIKRSRSLDLVLPFKGNNHETMTSECYSSGVSQRVLSSFSYMPSSTTSRLTKGKTTEEEVAGESDTIIITTAAPVDVETLD